MRSAKASSTVRGCASFVEKMTLEACCVRSVKIPKAIFIFKEFEPQPKNFWYKKYLLGREEFVFLLRVSNDALSAYKSVLSVNQK